MSCVAIASNNGTAQLSIISYLNSAIAAAAQTFIVVFFAKIDSISEGMLFALSHVFARSPYLIWQVLFENEKLWWTCKFPTWIGATTFPTTEIGSPAAETSFSSLGAALFW